VKEVEPEPLSYPTACSSQYSDVWVEAIKTEFDGLMTAGKFADESDIPEGCSIVDAKWLCKWKGDSHDVIDGAKANMVAIGYSQVERVD
ncbi:unnamed protein product, partial [Sphacelaria rigidula]